MNKEFWTSTTASASDMPPLSLEMLKEIKQQIRRMAVKISINKLELSNLYQMCGTFEFMEESKPSDPIEPKPFFGIHVDENNDLPNGIYEVEWSDGSKQLCATRKFTWQS